MDVKRLQFYRHLVMYLRFVTLINLRGYRGQ